MDALVREKIRFVVVDGYGTALEVENTIKRGRRT